MKSLPAGPAWLVIRELTNKNITGPAWLVIRELTNKNIIGEAIGIDRFHKHGEEQWLGANGMHARMDKLLGRGNWTYSIVTKAEWETFRDLHGFTDFGEE